MGGATKTKSLAEQMKNKYSANQLSPYKMTGGMP